MKTTANHHPIPGIFLVFALSLLFPLFSYSQTFFGTASVPTADPGTQVGPTPAAITPPAGMQSGDLVIIYGQYRANSITISINQAGGQTWNTVTPSNSGSTQSTMIFWCTFNGTWSANPSIRVPAGNTQAITSVMYVFRPTNSNTQWAVNVNQLNTNLNTNPNTINSVTTTANNTVTMAFWGSAATNTWNTLAGAGWSKTSLNVQNRNTSTTGQTHTAAYRIMAAAGATGNVAQTQSATTTALRSIMSWCERPANDLCANATLLSSGPTCVNTAGSVVNASYTATLTDCSASTPVYDVWYRFVAQSVNPTITLSLAAGNANFLLPRMQLFSGTCGGFTSIACAGPFANPGSGNINATGLTLGNTYYVRVYSLNGTAPTSNGAFNICITDPVPNNNLCTNATVLTSSNTCNTINGTLGGASYTAGGGVPGCGAANLDVWYSFVAQSSNPTITTTLTSGTGLRRSELYQGTCGSLTSITCSGDNNNLNATGLTVGQTYYVRVYSNNTSPYAFTICVVDPPVNDLCDDAVTLSSGITCITTSGTLTNATYTSDASCGAANLDVWYNFVAQSTNPTITTTLTSGSGQRRTELYSGTCGSLSSITCSGNSNNIAATGLTIGQLYYVRVYSNNTSPYNFTICVTDPATSNNLCGSSILLTSSISCTLTAGNMYGSTLTAPTIAGPDCSGGLATYDVWYHFVAQKTNPTITLNNMGVTFTGDAHLQLFTNSCSNPMTPLFCGTTSINANYLTPGTTYKIRVYGTGTIPATPTGNGFDICVTDPVSPTPSNDECSGAVNLSVGLACGNVPGDMAGATPSVSVPLNGSCPGTLVYDVWYKFAAVSTNATVTLSSFGTNFQATRGIEVFSTTNNTCATLTSIGCNATSVAVSGLTVGNTYFVRVYSSTAPPPNGNARFNICVTSNLLPVVRFGNSYVNVSKKTTGGVVERGDTLEVRMTINYNSGTTLSALRFVDNIPSHTTMLSGTNDSIRVITNEGLTFRRYTPNADADPATYLASPPAGQYNIRMNLGFGASNPGTPPDNTSTNSTATTGTMNNTNRPSGSGILFATAYRVVATGNIGDTIVLYPAQFVYNDGTSDVALSATSYKILISQPLSLCSNSIGLNNATEYGGTFGSGSTLNRGADLTTPIAGYSFLNDVNAYNSLGDGRYAIVKNISPRSRTNRNANYARACGTLAFDDPLNCNNRMHGGHWYIDGDHTGTNNAIGNVPPNETTNSGYMLMVNADYVASEVFSQTINNLCPNTYYEFSAWFRNICPTCGVDSLGQQFAGTPTAPSSGYPGVYPNLSFALNGLDYYSTGELDTVGWLKKGFVFRTGASQTNATFSIRNNSQGGGGNDWVMDDIAVATCLPTMSYAPTINPTVCETNPFTLSDTISSYFKNYTTYKWQRSINGGSSWTDVTGVTTLADTNYYITNYTVAPANTTLADSGDLYRVVVATTAANLLNPNCNISDGTTITLSVIDCNPILDIELLSFTGKLVNDYANLYWETSREDEQNVFIIEKSFDQQTFTPIGSLNSNNNPALEKNYYSFKDPVPVTGKTWYRLVRVKTNGKKQYSKVIFLNKYNSGISFGNVSNPFDNKLDFEIFSDRNTKIDVYLLDVSGKPIQRKTYMIYTGLNSLSLDNTSMISHGVYTLRIQSKESIVTKKVVKKH